VPHRNTDASIYYRAVGRGRPFVMLHGSPSDHRVVMHDLEPVFRTNRGWRRVYPDLPGHGRTPGSPRIRDMDDYLDVVVEFVRRVARSGKVALGGVSFGAYLALAVARRNSSLLRGLLLSVPEISHSPREDLLDLKAGLGPESAAEAFRPRTGYAEDTQWLESLPFRDVSVDLYGDPRKVSLPTLMLFGRQDAGFRAQTYWKLLPRFPHATFAVLDGASHEMWRERGAIARELVSGWLDRMTPRASRRP
jgi:pimeloyl-ACP methyl ester carboxylesterase